MNSILKNGMLYTAIGRFSTLIVQFLINVVLSRLLTPKEYGVVAIVQVFIVFFQLLVEAGMGPAIIQEKSLNETDNSVLFNFSLLFALTMAVLFGFFGYILAYFYDNTIYIKLCWLQAIAIFFNGNSIVPTALLNKRKKFKLLNLLQVISSGASGVVGITCALENFGVYSLILSSIMLSMVNFILVFSVAKIKPILKLKWKIMQKILSFSIHQFGFNFINYFSRNADNILVGKFMGPIALGNYSKAYQLLMMPNSILLGIINPVLQPVLSEYQDDIVVIKKAYFDILRIMALIGFALSFFLSIFAKQIIFLIFGNQWNQAVLPFSILALTVWIQMTLSTSGAVFQARNKAKELMVTGVISAMLLVSSIVIGVFSGDLVILSCTLSIGFLLNFMVSFHRLMNLVLDDSFWTIIKLFWKPFLVGTLTLVDLLVTNYMFKFIKNDFLFLCIQGSLFIIFFVLNASLMGEFKFIKSLFKS